ncbi:hypothetical protein GZL_07401 [Streptomyces sp. 769]|nr:hypothetical protein GZL_07401 [Streptomyces sp. 769]
MRARGGWRARRGAPGPEWLPPCAGRAVAATGRARRRLARPQSGGSGAGSSPGRAPGGSSGAVPGSSAGSSAGSGVPGSCGTGRGPLGTGPGPSPVVALLMLVVLPPGWFHRAPVRRPPPFRGIRPPAAPTR